MKKIVVLAFVLVLAASAAFAEYDGGNTGNQSSKATATVAATVVPDIAVGVQTPFVNAGFVKTGVFSTDILFRIDANNEQVVISAEASALYKGGIVDGYEVLPIPVTGDVVISPDAAGPMGTEDNVAAYTMSIGDIDGFPTLLTESIPFDSKQAGHFSQGVAISVSWDQNDTERPTGEYKGRVGLTAFLMP